MKKKLLIFFLMMTMLIGINTINCAAESEYTLDDQIGVLKSLNVMKGDPNGNFRLDDYVTRAEFTKMAIAISPVRNAVASQLSVSPFKDVSYTYWAAPYIRLAVTSGYISGYTDSTFRPSNQVTYAEAVTVALKLLGYTDDDFGAAWPYGQMGTASNLGLTDGISGDYNSPLTRGACVILLNNLLDTKIKSGSSKYASSVDCEIKEGVILIATKNEDPTISEGKIYTTGGTYKIPDDFDRNYIGARGDIVVRNGDEIIDFIATDTANLEKIVVYSTLGNAVIGYEGGVLTQVTIPTTTTAYMGTAISTFSGVSPKIDMGTVITMKKDKKGNIEYINVNQGTNLKGPIVVTGGNWYGSYVSDLSNVIIIRDGVKSTVSDIKKNDIAYYSADLNMMFVYVNSKTGIYESASPNKDMPSSITVSGVTYGLEGVDAFNALCSTGSLEYGDTIKVLLGKDGKVAGAVSADSASDTVYGYLVGSGKKTFTNAKGSTYSSYYIELVTPDGDKNEYTTAVSCQNYVNRVVKLTFSDGNAIVKTANTQNGVSGMVDAVGGTIGSCRVASNVNILDISSTNGGDIALYKNIYLKRIDGIKLNAEDIIYFTKNENGEINNIILKNITGDIYEYGLITKVDNRAKTYTFDINGNPYSTSGSYTGISAGAPAKFVFKGSSLDSMTSISAVKGAVTNITSTKVITASSAYTLSDNVVIYTRKALDTAFTILPKDELLNNIDSYNISAYYDKTDNSGGRVRVIIAVEK